MKHTGFAGGVFILVCLSLIYTHVFSQSQDVVYLKNGSIIKGTIMELVPDKTVKIETSDGSIFIYNLSEVEKISKEQIQESGQTTESSHSRVRRPGGGREFRKNSGTVFAGVALPVGDFSSSLGDHAGMAQTGIALGIDGNIGVAPELDWMVTGNVAFNSMDVSPVVALTGYSIDAGSWTTIWMMTGLKAHGPVAPNIEISGFGEIGLLIGMIPEVHFFTPYGSSSQNSSTASAFCFSLGGGVSFNRFGLIFRYLGGEPEFTISAAGTGGAITGKYKQPMALIQILGSLSF